MRISRPAKTSKNPPAGNALFLILIAVALFAALSYAVTTSSRSGGDIAKEKTALAVAQVDSAIALYRAAVMRMTALGLSSERLDGSLPPHTSETNSSCASAACRIFDPTGGGLAPFVMTDASLLDAADTQSTMRFMLGSMGSGVKTFGTTLLDVMAYMRVSEAFCLAYNKAKGFATVAANSYDPPFLSGPSAFAQTLSVVSFWGPLNSGKDGCQQNTNASALDGAGYYIFALMHVR